ncbi:MAG TPA: hypothetical protein VFR37_04545 [Longimicrobium sp.]|nr:hypothetical protein [Longimicrobium sp.]
MTDLNPGATVHDLIHLREQLTSWIARLDEVGGQANTRAAERIRADYVSRLQRVNEDLSAHRGEIEADLERFRGTLAQAEEHRLTAADEMDEASLRHLIGELDEAAWEEARPALEGRVRDAEDAVARAREEVERLETLAAGIEGAGASASEDAGASAFEDAVTSGAPAPADFAPDEAEPGPVPAAEAGPTPFDAAAMEEFEPSLPDDEPGFVESTAPAETADADATVESPSPAADVREAAEAASVDEWDPFGNEFGTDEKRGDAEEDLPWLEGIDQAAAGSTGGWTPPAQDEGLDFLREIEESTRTPASPAAGDLGADDLAFLEELDRAIGSSPSAGAAKSPTPPPTPPAATPPAAASGSKAEPLLCKECGAINEPHAWYCEICGSEL